MCVVCHPFSFCRITMIFVETVDVLLLGSIRDNVSSVSNHLQKSPWEMYLFAESPWAIWSCWLFRRGFEFTLYLLLSLSCRVVRCRRKLEWNGKASCADRKVSSRSTNKIRRSVRIVDRICEQSERTRCRVRIDYKLNVQSKVEVCEKNSSDGVGVWTVGEIHTYVVMRILGFSWFTLLFYRLIHKMLSNVFTTGCNCILRCLIRIIFVASFQFRTIIWSYSKLL